MLDAIFSFDTLWWVLMLLYIPACIGLIAIVLLQKGKGVGFAGAFGAGGAPGSDTVFGPRMSQSLPVRMTYIAASLFMIIAVVMSLIAGQVGRGDAPELAEETGTTVSGGISSGLDAFGIGTGEVDAARLEETPEAAPETEAEAVAPESELSAGAEMNPTIPEGVAEATAGTSLEEATSAAEALVESAEEAVVEAVDAAADAVQAETPPSSQ